MTNISLKSKIIPIIISSFIVGVLVFSAVIFYQKNFLKEVEAGVSHNVSGWAWSETIGWLSVLIIPQEGGAWIMGLT